MIKFNDNVSIEETTEYQTGELMNELNQQIEVNDKVKWIGYRGDEEVLLSATVESIKEVMGVTTLVVRKHGMFPEECTCCMISASRIIELKKGI
tara:strand:- start:109 stop:390 length:282 start_codon:yes stop_codon:yes gene_type:complete